ncbi:MAG TPA: zinc-dependent alcohol dehydrogenase family protein [bacterium]|jgi:propanol-preferring alcohol dehydrogenase|nr:zinc-dependent alcohol dehydrogenase family protein [bacterium]
MVLYHPGPGSGAQLRMERLPDPTPGAGEIALRVTRCAVCHTDLHIISGDLPPHKAPLVPGHQIVGIVERVGPGVTRFVPGDRVGIGWLYDACGRCDACRSRHENLCAQARFTGYDVDGGYAQFALANADFAYRIPGQFTDTDAAPLLCAGVIGYRALRLSGIEPGQRLGLFGFGASAHLVIQVARYWRCETYVFTRSKEHRELGRALGAVWAGGAEDAAPARVHAAIVFAPSGAVVVQALGHLERGGTVAINAIHLDRIPAFDYDRLYWERSLRSVSNITRADAEEFLALAGRIPVQTAATLFPLAEANTALAALRASRVTGAAVLDTEA